MNVETYWDKPPPEQSPGLRKWIAKVNAGWKPNRRLSQMNYYTAAEYYKVYLWEYLNVLWPLLEPPKSD